jgi:hypothetical protein
MAVSRNSLVPALLACLLWTASAFAQYTVGRVEGTVADATGAVISGAQVSLRSVATNATRTFTTTGDGLFVFFAVPPGEYELSAEAPRFGRRAARLKVVTSETVTHHLALPVAREATQVEVSDEGSAVESLDVNDPQHSITRSDLELTSLPSLGRNMISFVQLAPGVQPMNNPRGGSTFGGGGSLVLALGPQAGLFSANGGRQRAGAVQLDYTDANDWEFGGFALGMQSITPDMLQEFKLLTSNYSAEYGVKSNAEVVMVSRSGTNRFHGAAYDFVQNGLFNARDYFDTSGTATPLQSNIYGVTAGGPVIKDRTFVFGAYEGRRIRGNAFTTLATLPTEAARQTATDPIIVQLMDDYLPLPVGQTSNPLIGTLATRIPSPIDSYQLLLKADHRFSEKQTASARYLQSTGSFVARSPGANTLPGFDSDLSFKLRNVNLSDSYALNARTVNELRLSYGYAEAQGMPQNGVSTPRFQISGLVNFGAVPINPSGRLFNTYQVNDTLSHFRGAHVLKMGFDVRRIQDNSILDTNTRGVFTFPSLPSFLAGQPSGWTQSFGSTRRGFRTGLYSGYFQDDWKLRPTLTVNLGARWEMQGALDEAKGQIAILDPSTPGPVGAAGTGPLGSFRIGGPAVEANPINFAPRLGFAWNPHSGNLVVRGGYGIYYDAFTFGPLGASRSAPPFNYMPTLTCVPGHVCQITGVNSFDNLVNGTALIQSQTNAQLGTFGTLTNFGSITTVDPRLKNPYVQQFSLTTEYRLARNYVVGLSYIGAKGTHLTRLIPLNPVVNGPAPATSVADEITRLAEFQAAVAQENGPGNIRLDPRFDQVNLHDSRGSSIYHSLQATATKSFSHGLQFQASYTWSKSIDDASDFSPTIQANDNSYAQDGFDLGAERAVSNFDIPHRVIVTGLWQVPFFHSFRGVAGKVLDGWSFESVNMWQSGVPATLLAGPLTVRGNTGAVLATFSDVNLDGNFIPTGSDNTRPNCAPAARFVFGDPAANAGITQPLLGNNGTCGRNSVRMNSLTNFDWSFFKNFELTESGPAGSGPWVLQFRAEMYNIFNVPFLTAQTDAWRTVSSPRFGLFNAAGLTRRMQLALRLSW